MFKMWLYKKRNKKTASAPILKNNENPQKSITVITKEDQKLNTLPSLKVECPKCGKAYLDAKDYISGDFIDRHIFCFKCNALWYNFKAPL